MAADIQEAIQAALKAQGWGLFQTGPNEWLWIKVDIETQKMVAVQDEQTWHDDVVEAMAS